MSTLQKVKILKFLIMTLEGGGAVWLMNQLNCVTDHGDIIKMHLRSGYYVMQFS
jgi:hypothetical protein